MTAALGRERQEYKKKCYIIQDRSQLSKNGMILDQGEMCFELRRAKYKLN